MWLQHRCSDPDRLTARAFTTPFAAPTSTALDPSTGPKFPRCSNRESKGPRRRLDGCKGIHDARSQNCAKEERHVSTRFSRLLSSHLYQTTTDGACWWHTPQAKSKDHGSAGTSHTRSRLNHLINLTCPWTTLTELSAAPLDRGSLSADVSCTTSPGHANFTALSSARMEGSLSHRNTTLWYPNCPNL